MSDVELAGNRMTVRQEGDKMTVTFDNKGTGRVCGSCTLCCRLLPVLTLKKPANTKCRHQGYKGCGIYQTRPLECRSWTCRWLSDVDAAGMPRPDRAHYVMDIEVDYITKRPHDGAPPTQANAYQVWVDPAHRDAWRTPALRRFMFDTALKHKVATIVRFSSNEAIVVVAPPLSLDGTWLEIDDVTLRPKNAWERALMDGTLENPS